MGIVAPPSVPEDRGCSVLGWRCYDEVLGATYRGVKGAGDEAWWRVRQSRNQEWKLRGSAWARANGGTCVQREQGMVLCHGVSDLGSGPREGLTIGNAFVTSLPENRVTLDLLSHEAKHSDQWAVLGDKFAAIYVGDWLASRAAGRGDCQLLEGLAGYEDGGYRSCA